MPFVNCHRAILRTCAVIALAALGGTLARPTAAEAQTLTATITYPANGATAADLSESIQWTTVAAAQAYYLYVGTTVGAKNLVDTGELQVTSYRASTLPANLMVYARLWTKVGGTWRSVDSTFTAAPLFATFVYPPAGTTNLDVTQPWSWTSVPNLQAYYLYVGSTPGANDLANSGEIQTTSYAPLTLPTGRLLYARLWTKVNGTWRYVEQTVSSPAFPRVTFPVDGATGVDASQPIRWTTVTGAEAYYLYIGNTVGASDVLNSGEIQQTSHSALDLPPNRTLYVRVWAKVGGVWRYSDSSFSLTVLYSRMIYPANGATNADASEPLRWTTVPDATSYYLYVGTTLGATDVVNSGETLQTSYPSATLLVNQTLYGRVWAKVGGTWRGTDTSFRYSTGLAPVLTHPANGSTTADFGRAFTWTSVTNADAYYLKVGTTPGGTDLVDTGEISQLSSYVSNLPTGQTLHATISARLGGVWRSTASTFAGTVMTAQFINPATGADHADPMEPITWTAVDDVQAYYLYVGSTPGAKDIIDSRETLQASWPATDVPLNQTVYGRIWSRVGGVWRYSDASFAMASLRATLTYPLDGATEVDRRNRMTWTSVPNAESYRLSVGSTPGASDLIDSGETLGTFNWMLQLPVGRTIHVRLATRTYGQWRHVDSTFTAEPLAAEFIHPLEGAVGVNQDQPFEWTAAIGAEAYRLTVGTTPGGSDVATSSDVTTRSYVVSGLPATGLLYARVWTRIGGTWARHSDVAFTRETTAEPPTIVVPAAGATNFNAMLPFEWTEAGPLARGYRLTIGTTSGGSDLHDSGPIHVTRRFVPNLPVGVPLFGRVQARIGDQWHATDFSFTVAMNSVSSAQQIKVALWATDFARTLAFDDNRARSGHELFALVSPRYDALCSDFAAVLLQLLAQTNIQTSARMLHVSFNATELDIHTLVELLDADTQRWVLFDPTFNVTATRTDGELATAEEVSQATLTFDWNAIVYEPLGDAGDAFLRGYYLDYPLLYANVYHGSPTLGQGPSPLPYLQEVSIPSAGGNALFVVRCLGGSTTDVVVNGSTRQVACNGADLTSAAFFASSVSAPSESPSFQLYTVKRFLF